jgi:hypothetical protein
MVKKKASPLRGKQAGLAAATAPSHSFSTLSESSEDSSSSDEDDSLEQNVRKQPQPTRRSTPLLTEKNKKTTSTDQQQRNHKILQSKVSSKVAAEVSNRNNSTVKSKAPTRRHAFRDIRFFQRTSHLLIPRAPFLRSVSHYHYLLYNILFKLNINLSFIINR